MSNLQYRILLFILFTYPPCRVCVYTGWPKNGTIFVRLNFIKY